LEAYKFLAKNEGVFAEPASCAPVAGLFKLKKLNFFKEAKKEQIIVCTLTGHGLKDPKIAISCLKEPVAVAATLKAVLKAAKIK